MRTAYIPEDARKTKMLGIMVTPSMHDEFSAMATELGKSKTALGRWVIEQWMAERDAKTAKD